MFRTERTLYQNSSFDPWPRPDLVYCDRYSFLLGVRLAPARRMEYGVGMSRAQETAWIERGLRERRVTVRKLDRVCSCPVVEPRSDEDAGYQCTEVVQRL